jgi:hypothetical protein
MVSSVAFVRVAHVPDKRMVSLVGCVRVAKVGTARSGEQMDVGASQRAQPVA